MIRQAREGAVWTLTLARPEKANSLTGAMLAELAEAVEAAAGAAQVLVITGEGKVFSAGADLEEAKAGLTLSPAWERLSAAVAAYPGLSVAALNGTLAGGAFGMVLACDLRIAAEGATFFYPVMRLGFLPQPSDPARLAALVGPGRARALLMAGERWDAPTALAAGLVDRVVPADALGAAVDELSADARAADAGHVRAIKALFRRKI